MSAISGRLGEHKSKQIEGALPLHKQALANARLDRIRTDVNMEEMPRITANRASLEELNKVTEKVQGLIINLEPASTSTSSKRVFPSEA